MATPVSNNTTTQNAQAAAAKKASSVTTNPKAKLDKDAFMKLLLTELKYQDPTQPMDSEKMLTQTSQLATLETQENTNKMMKELADQLKAQSSNGMNAYAISAIGKMATIGDVSLKIDDKTTATKFDLNFNAEVESGVITISDKDGNEIETMQIEKGTKGVASFTWDVKNSNGKRVEHGIYNVSAKYTDTKGNSHTVEPGSYPVEAVRFEKGVAQLKLGSTYVPITSIKEFSEIQKG